MGNLGNDATLWSVLHHLHTRQPTQRIACVCAELPDFAHAYGVTPLALDPLKPPARWRIHSLFLREAYVAIATAITELARLRRVSAELRDAKRLLVIGTGVLDDYGMLPWALPAWLYRWVASAKRRRLEVEFVGAGAGPIELWLNRRIMLAATALADRRSYRDEVSRAYMASHGVSAPTDEVVPDLAFGLPLDEARARRAPSVPAKTVGVGLMGYFGWRNNHAAGANIYREYLGKMVEFVRWLLEGGYGVRLLIGELRTDDQAVADLRAALAREHPALDTSGLVANRIAGVGDLLRELVETDVVVASRFHNLVFALALGRPAISIGYSSKFEPLMEGVGLSEYCHRIETLDVQALMRNFEELVAEQKALSDRIAGVVRGYRAMLDRLFDRVFAS